MLLEIIGIGFTAILLLYVVLRVLPTDIRQIRKIDDSLKDADSIESIKHFVRKQIVIAMRATFLVLLLIFTIIMFSGGIIVDVTGDRTVAIIGIICTAVYSIFLMVIMIPYKKLVK